VIGLILALAVAAADPVGAVAAPPYAVETAPYRPVARFVVGYAGAGANATRYHSEPPNAGGAADVNDARDTGSQRWALTFRRPLVIPACAAGRETDPCRRVGGLTGATGTVVVAGTVDHVHDDGLYRALDRAVRCRVRWSAPRGYVFRASIDARYAPRRRAVVITARDPVTDADGFLPGACPQQGDSVDRLLDNYFTPGFSFATGYGPERWFVSRSVAIPVAVLHRARLIRIRLSGPRPGAAPAGCAVSRPSIERCRIGGAWSGVLTLRAAGS
jgi:hypothetical protein